MTLRYGNPPKLSECVDIGTVPGELVPRSVSNAGLYAMDPSVFQMTGFPVPAYRRVWLTIGYYRDKDVPVPWSCTIPGLGTLVYSDTDPVTGTPGDNWQVI